MRFFSPNPVHGLTQDARLWLSRSPTAFYAALRLFGNAQHAVRPETEIVIEGFPRCANGFFLYAFRAAQRRPIHVAHHLHSPAQALRGLERGLPVVVLLRSPKATVISLQTFAYVVFGEQFKEDAGLSANRILRRYLAYHEQIEPIASQIVCSPFGQTTSSPNDVIAAINAHFMTTFRQLPKRHQINFKIVEQCAEDVSPNRSRNQRKALFIERFERTVDPALLKSTEDLHAALVASAKNQS